MKYLSIRMTSIMVLIVVVLFCWLWIGNAVYERSITINAMRSVLYVGGTGPGNFSHINDALAAASDNDMIYVFDDGAPYHEHLDVDKSVRLVGENRDTTIIDGDGNSTVVILRADNIWFEGFTVRHGGHNWSDALVSIRGAAAVVFSVVLADSDYGVLINASECIVQTSVVSDCRCQIYVADGVGNQVVDNNLSAEWGIGFESYQATRTVFRDNVISVGEFVPVGILGGTDTEFIGNSVESTGYQSLIMHGGPHVLRNNTFKNCGLDSFYDYVSCVVVNNTVNGKPLVYLENHDGGIISDGGQVLLVNCSNVTMTNLTISSVPVGVFLFNTRNCVLMDSDLFDNWVGVNLFRSVNNRMSRLSVHDNDYIGIDIGPFSNNTRVDNCTVNRCNDGVQVWSADNIIHENRIDRNYNGVDLFLAVNTRIADNVVTNNTQGIDLWQENSMNVITGNLIHNNTGGVVMHYSNVENNISFNTLADNTYGVFLNPSNDDTEVYGNVFSRNERGIRVDSSRNRIASNSFIDNTVIDATFLYSGGLNVPLNNWNGNYWGRARFLPRPIFGVRYPLPWINVDWRPLSMPP